MKKLSFLLAIIMIITFSFFALASGEEEKDSDQGSSSVETTDNEETETDAAAEDNSSLGDYSVVIDSCRLAKDYEGKDVVIVKYIFGNVSDDDEGSASFYLAIEDKVYQNGVGLNEAYVLDEYSNYNSDNQTKEVKKGYTLDVEVAYELNDTTSEIEVEVAELYSFSTDPKVITKTFSIA